MPPPYLAAAAAPAPDLWPSRAAPPQSPPPAEPSWEFLNPFYENQSYYRAFTPSRDSEELREEEGIPDLEEVVEYDEIEQEEVSEVEEDDEIEQEEVKEVEEDKKTVVDGGAGGGEDLEKVADESDAEIVVEESGGDVNLVEEDEIVVIEDENRHDGGGVGAAVMYAKLEFVLREIKAQFYIASESGNEISKLLDVGKVPYRGRNAVYKVSSKTLDVVAPPFSVVSRSTKSTSSAEKNFNVDEYIKVNSRNLSSTLEKLYIWEKKLHEQVKAEEKLRIIYDRKRKQLKHMDERGVEPHKLVSTQTFVRKLSDKLKIAIQFVDSISSTITKLRDEELWLQINELIHGLGRMWKVMLECHQSQCRLISEANNLDSVASGGRLIDAHKEATMQLELELLKWLSSFYAWISAQKAYIRTLNEWLLKCLHYVPEETDDGIAPYSPSRIGAPPVFVICNHWSQAMERLSENEVFTAMQTFSMSVLQLWEQHYEEQRQSMMTNNDMKRRLKSLKSDIQKVKKAFSSVNKKLLVVSEQSGMPLPGQLVHRSVTTNVSSLQCSLKQIFEAMDKFSAESMEVYEELRKRSEEQLATESAKGNPNM
ncbi:nitrate regulatory gene2-like protein [Cinnamomum micranthum f. kanehirae]|uniref:Nitrate regulatory gene2-like protein n=1 Tax=Cinnamomum micranthum f. kanehirae TaxID=337451 RepID=A0A3S3N4Y0_9MAGN|nr:nitrate regulatory gene2-like protein [Cinnamomum micranthum f. kanehirae]